MRSLGWIFAALILFSCTEQTDTDTRLTSKDYPSKEERITILKQETNLPSEIKDAEFSLFNVNGFTHSRTTIPGASSWDYQIAVKIDTADIKSWIDNLAQLSIDTTLSWTGVIPEQRKKEWICKSKPAYYIHKNVIMVFYRPEGILFRRQIQN